MAKQPTVTSVTSGFQSAAAMNTNFQNIKNQFSNTVSRDGSSPNAMAGDLDMNGNDILNVGTMDIASLTVNNVEIDSIFTDTGLAGDINSLNLVLGDILYYNGSNIVRLGIGSEEEVLKVSSGVPTWAADSDNDTVGITVEEDDTSIQTNVTVLNFLSDLLSTWVVG